MSCSPARYYDPGLRRFTQPDTIIPDPTSPQDLNRYSYVRNNPVSLNDPSGHAPCEWYRTCRGDYDPAEGDPNYSAGRFLDAGAQTLPGQLAFPHEYLGAEWYDYDEPQADLVGTVTLGEFASDLLDSATSLAGACALVAGGVTLLTSGAGAGTFAVCGTLTAAGGAAQVAVGTLRGDGEQVVAGGFNAAGGVFSRLAGTGTRTAVALTRGDDALLFTDDFVRSETAVSLVTDVGFFIGGTAATQSSTPTSSPLGCRYGECG